MQRQTKKSAPRRPYEKPGLKSSRPFERLALGCTDSPDGTVMKSPTRTGDCTSAHS